MARQLVANTTPDLGGPGTSLIKNVAGRVGHFVGGVASGRGSIPGGSMMSSMMPGVAEEGTAGAGEAAGAAGGIGAIAEEAAPLLLAA